MGQIVTSAQHVQKTGVERNTEYVMEQMFQIVDGRYRSRKPLIVTTNLTLKEMKNSPDLAHECVYDRILERCAPIVFDNRSFRAENVAATKEVAKELIKYDTEDEIYL